MGSCHRGTCKAQGERLAATLSILVVGPTGLARGWNTGEGRGREGSRLFGLTSWCGKSGVCSFSVAFDMGLWQARRRRCLGGPLPFRGEAG